jgi:uncharacterized protein YcbX
VSDVELGIASLHVHPVKSCAGIAVDEAILIETGFEYDREWMVVDPRGEFVTQRELPRMALISTSFKAGTLMLRAPGMLALHLALDAVEGPTRVTVWDDTLAAFDMGDLAAQWFSDFLGRPLRLARFDPDQTRIAESSRRWSGPIEARSAFSDAFPLLVASTASLAEFNARLAKAGHAAVTMQRFRPNLVLEGLDAHGEDQLDEIRFAADGGDVVLRLVKPCSRCSIPDVDPTSGETGHAVGDMLASYRADARLDGALTFGMNAVIVDGLERTLRTGQAGRATIRFD